MANLIAMNILNRKYIDDTVTLINHARKYLGFENKEYDEDIEWADDACVVYHSEILEPSKLRFGALYEIFSSEERCKYGLVELDMEHLGFMYIETDNGSFITVSESDKVDLVFEYIIRNEAKVIDLVNDCSLIWVPVQITKDMMHKENKELLQRIYEYSLAGLE